MSFFLPPKKKSCRGYFPTLPLHPCLSQVYPLRASQLAIHVSRCWHYEPRAWRVSSDALFEMVKTWPFGKVVRDLQIGDKVWSHWSLPGPELFHVPLILLLSKNRKPQLDSQLKFLFSNFPSSPWWFFNLFFYTALPTSVARLGIFLFHSSRSNPFPLGTTFFRPRKGERSHQKHGWAYFSKWVEENVGW